MSRLLGVEKTGNPKTDDLRAGFRASAVSKIVFVFVVVYMLAGCNGKSPFEGRLPFGKQASEADSGGTAEVHDAAVDTASREAPEFAVHAVSAVRGEITDYLELGGDVVSKGAVDAYPEASGKLTRLYKKVGEYVEKDEPLAVVDPSKPGMNYVAHTVTSPISGTITAMPVDEGATVAPSVPIAKIGRLDDLEIHSYVPERYISRVRTGMRAEIHLEAYPAVRFGARIVELSPVVDPVSRTMQITLTFDSYDRRVKSGMYASVMIRTETKTNTVLIPTDAILTRFGGTVVFVIADDGRVRLQPVTEGIRRGGVAEIVEGLAGDEEIVVAGQSLLEDGSEVRVVKELKFLRSGDAAEAGDA